MATLPLLDILKSQQKTLNDIAGDSYLKNFNDKLGIAFFSSFVMSLLLYPLDTVKRNMQLNGSRGCANNYKGSLDCLTSLGAKSLYRGVHIYAVKEVITAFA